MKVRVKKLHPDAVVPQYAKPGDSGFDFVALEDTVIGPGETKLVKTGIAVEIPEGFELQVRPRSGTSLKTPLRVANAPGTVDSGYRGECCVIMTNTSNFNTTVIKGVDEKWYQENTQFIKKGDRIAQGVICPVIRAEFELAEELSDSVRGVGGFGSTGV
jgi:dUTP pyrophosphatase